MGAHPRTGGFDGALRAAAAQLGPHGKVKEIQLWCHGGISNKDTGRAIGIKCGDAKAVPIDRLDFSVFRGKFTRKGVIWFRACWQAGSPGQGNEAAMARVCANAGCQFVAGHKCVIGPAQLEMYLFDARRNSFTGPRSATASPSTSAYDIFYDVM